jgi:hypothetical protein
LYKISIETHTPLFLLEDLEKNTDENSDSSYESQKRETSNPSAALLPILESPQEMEG